MEHLGQLVIILGNTARYQIAGAGTQTAALGFWWYVPVSGQEQVSTTDEEYSGTTWATSPGSMNTARRCCCRRRNFIFSNRFWWLSGAAYPELLQLQQKNMMEQVGQHATGTFGNR
jgi:hypothetical protein